MKPKKILSFILAAAMMISLLPVSVFAEIGDGYGQCPHHTAHTAECGFDGGGTCTYICGICLAEADTLLSALPSLEELKQMNQDEKYEVMDLVDAIDRAKLNLSDAARELIDWTNYDAACIVLFMPDGFFGATISKGYLKSDYMPAPQFAFLNAHGEKAQILYSDLQTMSELLNVDENGKSEVFYLPEGAYTLEEIVDGEWDVSMEVDGIKADGLTFTAAAGELIDIHVQNGGLTGKFSVYNSDGTLYNEGYSFDEAFSALKSTDGGKLEYGINIDSDITVDSGTFALKSTLTGMGIDAYADFNGNITASGSAGITVLYGRHYGDITVKSGAALTVEDGIFYGDIIVESGASVIINKGEFYGTVTAQNGANVTVANSVEIADFKKDTGKNIVLGAQALSGYDSANGYDYIYYGEYNSEPIKWRVLDKAYNYDKTDASKTGMLLLTKSAFGLKKFGTNSIWSTSDARTRCADMFASSFSADEQKFVLQTNSDEILNDDTLFLLSYDDVCNSRYFPNAYTLNALYGTSIATWLLRTPYDEEYIYSVYLDAPVPDFVDSYRHVRPAFNLDTSKILFTSAAAGGKNGNVGCISKNGVNTTGEYKLTMLNESRKFTVTETTANGTKGETLTFNYSNAETGANEYISAMIVDENNEVMYYGQLAEATSASGAVSFNIPTDINGGTYELRLFNEQINGGKKTDFSSNFQIVTLNVADTPSSGGSRVIRYTIIFDTDGGNTITSQTVRKNSKATEPKAPTKEGYIFDGWYTDRNFTAEYDFDTKVTKNITLYAKWTKDEVQEPIDDKKDDNPQTSEWANPFTDVFDTDWFFDNVKYANENGLMSGVTNTEFAPNLTLTRGMLVTILYRLAGEPAVNKSIPFADVTADSYYRDAVIWAQQNDIVSGISETEFAPDDNITREQIAVIMYRYVKYTGIAPVGAWAVKLDYADLAEISDYAVEGVMYCTMKNIMQGKDNNMFAPKDNTTRAEIAAILNRFVESNK